jgi:nucleotide-binding universal stress UspA family protein
MKKFDITKILVPTDFSANAKLATDRAVEMAQLYHAEIILLHVIEKHSFAAAMGDFILGRKIDSSKSEFAPERLKALSDLLSKQFGVSVTYEIAEGNIHTEIIKAAENHEADIIVMGADSTVFADTSVIGHVAHRVINQNTVPVITVQPNQESANFKTIVLPIDATLHSRERVNHATALAQKYNSVVHLVGILNDNDERSRQKLRLILTQVKDYFDKHEVPYVSENTLVEHTAKSTLSYAEKVKADLILVMTEENLNILGGAIGDYAEYMVSHSPIPVMCVRACVNTKNIEMHPYGF